MERLMPEHDTDQWAQHQYRYEVAARYVRGTDTVLDAACGIGYGRDILPGRWIGADKEVFVQGVLQVDLNTWEPDFDYDVFVGLETIEHLTTLDAYVAAAKRAKRIIAISTPIIPTTHFNGWHLHDFTKESLEAHFDDWQILHYESQGDIGLPDVPEVYGIWIFGR